MIPVIIGVMLIVFFFQAISDGDPARMPCGENASEEVVEAKWEELGLNDPIAVQFVRYLWNFFTSCDLGTSYSTKQPVFDEIVRCFPYTIKLAVLSIFVAVLIGVPLGVIAAARQYSVVDSIVLAFSVFFNSLPSFWLNLMAILLFGVKLGWVPASGVEEWTGWILPIVISALMPASQLIRMTRSSMLETIRQDYIRTAQAKGQSENVIIIKHVLRSSLIPTGSYYSGWRGPLRKK